MVQRDRAEEFVQYWSLFGYDKRWPFQREFRFVPGRRFRFDIAWPQCCVAVEVDGGQWVPYGGRHARDTDREKMRFAAGRLWLVMRVSPQELCKDPLSVCEQVVGLLEARAVLIGLVRRCAGDQSLVEKLAANGAGDLLAAAGIEAGETRRKNA